MEEFFNSCGDCYGPATPIPSSTPVPTPAPTQAPTDTPAPTPAYASFVFVQCGTTDYYYFQYDIGTQTYPVSGDVMKYQNGICYEVVTTTDYFDTDPIMTGPIYTDCTTCNNS
jgi:hypothetical protein